MRFKTDENLPGEAAHLLRRAGHDVETVPEEGLGGAKDNDLLTRCAAESRALITLDLGFSDLRAYAPSATAGILVLRPHRQAKPHILNLLRRAVRLLETEPVEARLWIVGEDQIRIRE